MNMMHMDMMKMYFHHGTEAVILFSCWKTSEWRGIQTVYSDFKKFHSTYFSPEFFLNITLNCVQNRLKL